MLSLFGSPATGHTTASRTKRPGVGRPPLRAVLTSPFHLATDNAMNTTRKKRISILQKRLTHLEARRDTVAQRVANHALAVVHHGDVPPPHRDHTYGSIRDIYAEQWGRLCDLCEATREMIHQLHEHGGFRYPSFI